VPASSSAPQPEHFPDEKDASLSLLPHRKKTLRLAKTVFVCHEKTSP
jgi:hypothetical protein